MATITKIYSTNDISPSKAATIYRTECGGVYYVCFNCGIQMNGIDETLAHIEYHFSSPNNINIDREPLDVSDIKCELLDGVSQEVVDSCQIEEIFIDCNNKSTLMNEEDCFQMNTFTDPVVQPLPQTLSIAKDNYSDLEGIFEWKCLYCATVLKKCTKLQSHLKKHIKEPKPRVYLESTELGRLKPTKAEYSFKCSLCPACFFDASSSRQHLKDSHDPQSFQYIVEQLPKGPISTTVYTKQISSRKAVSTRLPKVPMSTKQNGKLNSIAPTNVIAKIPTKVDSKLLLPQFNTAWCIFCDKRFNEPLDVSLFKLMDHTFFHFNLKIFRCPQCPAEFQGTTTAKLHMMKKHSINLEEEIKNVQCRFCSDEMDNLLDFVTHAFTHHLDNGYRNNSDLDEIFNYDCRFCSKNFIKWEDLHPHLKIHIKDELPNDQSKTNVRCLSERAKSGMHHSEFLYNCSGCNKTLCGSYEARNHWITEHKQVENNRDDKKSTKKTGLKCYDCDDVLDSEFSLKKHRLKHFNVLPYTCSVCAKSFSVSRNVSLHMKKVHHIKPDEDYCQLDCHYCKAEFTEEAHFITHMFTDHLYINFDIDENLDGRCKYECLYCTEIITERKLMDEHLEIHKNQATPIMEMDTDPTSAESSINGLRHNLEFTYCCLHCPKKFRLSRSANEHVRYKHKTEYNDRLKNDEDPKSGETHCNLCNITFLTWRSLLNHRSHRHPETHKVDRFKKRQLCYCSICGKDFKDRCNLRQHEDAHDRPQTYSCDICNNVYRTKDYIRTHMLSHINEKNFVCDQCGKSYYSCSRLNHHRQMHQNLKLPCDQCDKVFKTRFYLSEHKKIHNNNTRKKCTLCNKYFSNKSYRNHMRLHDGTKKYACRYCDMLFAQSSGRRGHERIRHEALSRVAKK